MDKLPAEAECDPTMRKEGAVRAGSAVVRAQRAGAVVLAVVLAALAAWAGPAGASDTSPVDLATPVDTTAAVAAPAAVVRSGPVRIEVLGPTLFRLEYSPAGRFVDAPTVNAVDRRFSVPPYTVRHSAGWLVVRTSRAVLRYRTGSGPFTPLNTSVTYAVDGSPTTAHPTWDWECTYGQVCQAGAATLHGHASLYNTQPGYDSPAGYIAFVMSPGDGATWDVLGARPGPAAVAVRYSTSTPVTQSLDLVAGGRVVGRVDFPPTASGDWGTATVPVMLPPGTTTVGLRCDPGDVCGASLDTLAIGPAAGGPPTTPSTGPLGGWIRGFDDYTNEPDAISCGPGQSGATCQAALEPLHTDGLLDTAGWRLLDDTRSDVWTSDGWVGARPPGGDVEDGYLFAYGHDYTGALGELAQLTGPAPLLPRSAFGVWYSDYTPYSASTITRSLLPAFRARGVPLDNLLLDTDWKAPNDWNGWEWSTRYFPRPAAFLAATRVAGVQVALNVHSSIDDHDPKLPEAERVAGTTLAPSSACSTGPCRVWDWSSEAQAESNFALQQPFTTQGVAFWWLDWCCDTSVASSPGVTPDAWIDHLYAQDLVNSGQRGFVLARIGSSEQWSLREYAAGVWSNHTSAVAFTGDAWGTWNTLAQEAQLTPDEASIGEPYVSDDIGSYHGPPPGSALDPPDLYDRWVQLGTFQPILRLHSADGDRLPWQYPEPVQGITESFLRLREALVPYSYTLGAEAHADGQPMDEPLYLADPDQPDAYDHPTEFLYGSQLLVAPVTTPGTVADTTVWFPPGRWIDYFTGATFTGPSTATLAEPLDRMPVFERAGGIVPEQPSTTTAAAGTRAPTVLDVASGAGGAFTLYDDAGTGLGYTRGQSATTSLVAFSSAAASGVVVGARHGAYPGAPARRSYVVHLVDLSAPARVTLDGRPLPPRPPGTAAPGWSYDASTQTVTVVTGAVAAGRATVVRQVGGQPTERAEPAPA